MLIKASIWSRGVLLKTSMGNTADRSHPCLELRSLILSWIFPFCPGYFLSVPCSELSERKPALFLKRERPEDGHELVQQLQCRPGFNYLLFPKGIYYHLWKESKCPESYAWVTGTLLNHSATVVSLILHLPWMRIPP